MPKRIVQAIEIGDLLKLLVLHEELGDMTNRALETHPELMTDTTTIPEIGMKLDEWRKENNVCLCKLVLCLTVMLLEKAQDNIERVIDSAGLVDEVKVKGYTIH